MEESNSIVKKTVLNLKRKEDLSDEPALASVGSFDIGMKNLAVCVIDRIEKSPGYRIRQWKLISLVSQAGRKVLKCTHLIKKRGKAHAGEKGKKCGARACWWNSESGVGYCGTHHRGHASENLSRYTTTKNIGDMELNRVLIGVLNEMPELWRDCQTVVMESQKTSRMKKIIYMIMSYLTHQTMIDNDRSVLQKIQVISASHKLAIPVNKLEIELPTKTKNGKDKKTYEGRKMLANEHCVLLLKNDHKNLTFFQKQKKKDDLADSFLQGLCFLLKND